MAKSMNPEKKLEDSVYSPVLPCIDKGQTRPYTQPGGPTHQEQRPIGLLGTMAELGLEAVYLS